jgi:hypothetical protein
MVAVEDMWAEESLLPTRGSLQLYHNQAWMALTAAQ